MILSHMYSTKFPKAENFRAPDPDFFSIWLSFQKEVPFLEKVGEKLGEKVGEMT